MMDSGGVQVTVVQKQLQKSITILKQCQEEIKELNRSSQPCIQSIKNLAEQYQCCVDVKLSQPINFNFSEVKEKLLFKISSEINDEILKLVSLINTLEDCCDKIDKQYEICMTECRKCKSNDEINYLVKKNTLYPALSDLLNKIGCIRRDMRESYSCKKYLLDSFSPDKPELCEAIETNWTTGDKDLNNKIEDCLSLTTYFMELKIL